MKSHARPQKEVLLEEDGAVENESIRVLEMERTAPEDWDDIDLLTGCRYDLFTPST